MVDFSWPLCLLMIVIVSGSLAFMWDVRQEHKE